MSRKWRRILSGFCFIVILAILWYAFMPPIITGTPVRLTRNASGEWQTTNWWCGRSFGPLFSTQLRPAEAKMFASGSIGSSGRLAHFACARIAILPQSDNLLLKRVAEGLTTSLMQQPFTREITYYPNGEISGVGEQAPDLYLTLKLDRFTSSGPSWGPRIDTRVSIQASSTFSGMDEWPLGLHISRDYRIDNNILYSPNLNYYWSASVSYQQSQAAINSASQRFRPEGLDIANAMATLLNAELARRIDQQAPSPDFPLSFYPTYQAPPGFAFLTTYRAKLLYTTHGLLTPTEACWRITLPKSIVNRFFDEVNREMHTFGWRCDTLRQGQQSMVLFADDDSQRLVIGCENESGAAKVRTVRVRYQARLTDAQFGAAIDELPVDPILAGKVYQVFFNRLTAPQQKRVIGILYAHPESQGRDWPTLANLLYRQQYLVEAKKALAYALVMQRITPDNTYERITPLADALHMDFHLTVQGLQASGFHRLSREDVPVLIVGASENALYYIPTDNGIETMAIHIAPVGDMTFHTYQPTYAEYSKNNRYVGAFIKTTGSKPVHLIGSNGAFAHWRFSVRRVSRNPLRFTVTPRYFE